MFDWVVVGGCAVGVARGCSDPRCAENRVQSRVPKKNREMGGCNTMMATCAILRDIPLGMSKTQLGCTSLNF